MQLLCSVSFPNKCTALKSIIWTLETFASDTWACIQVPTSEWYENVTVHDVLCLDSLIGVQFEYFADIRKYVDVRWVSGENGKAKDAWHTHRTYGVSLPFQKKCVHVRRLHDGRLVRLRKGIRRYVSSVLFATQAFWHRLPEIIHRIRCIQSV